MHTVIFVARFGRLPPEGISASLIFLPMSILSATALLFFFHIAQSRQRKFAVVLGYLLASPVAFVGSLFSGLFLPAIGGTLLLGGLPLVLGSALGYTVGKRWDV